MCNYDLYEQHRFYLNYKNVVATEISKIIANKYLLFDEGISEIQILIYYFFNF